MTKLSELSGGSGVTTYTNINQLPLGHSAGDLAFVDSSDRLYISNGDGWYSFSLINNTPTFTISPDASYELDSNGGVATTLNLVANDSDDNPLLWTFTTTDSAYDLATINNDSNGTFTITSKTVADWISAGYDSAGGSFDITFKVSDGISFANTTSTFIAGAAGVWVVDLSNVTYDSVSFNVGTQDVVPGDVVFNSEGTKMIVLGTNTDTLYQYSLSTGFDLSTASYDSVSFSVASQDQNPSGMTFNSDGTKMYIVGLLNDSVYQYSLSTGFDLSTASYDNSSFDVSSQEPNPYDVAFNSDGTKMFIIGVSNNQVYQYSLSTGFDISTASYDSVSFNYATQAQMLGFVFNPDGTKMYMVSNATDSIFQYSLSTGFDISTASYDSVSFSVASEDTAPLGINFSTDGTKLYMVGNFGNTIDQYSTGL